MSCPICNHKPEESVEINSINICSNCGSDLEIFDHIQKARRVESFQKKLMLVLTTMLGIVMVSWVSVSLLSRSSQDANSQVAPTEHPAMLAAPEADPLSLKDAAKPIEEFLKENESTKPAFAHLLSNNGVTSESSPSDKMAAPAVAKTKEKFKPVVPVKQEGFIIHKTRRGDSFWKISKKYFGNGNHANQIAVDNNLNPKKSIPLGIKLKIKK